VRSVRWIASLRARCIISILTPRGRILKSFSGVTNLNTSKLSEREIKRCRSGWRERGEGEVRGKEVRGKKGGGRGREREREGEGGRRDTLI
jgi:hypothetical protein